MMLALAAVLVLLLVSGVIDMVAFGPTPIMVGATSYRFDSVIDSRCSSANDVCFTVVGSVGESII